MANIRKPLYAGLLAAVTGLTVAIGGTATAQQPEGEIRGAGSEAAIAGSYVVKLKDQIGISSVDGTAAELTARHGGSVGLTYTAAMRGFSAAMSETQAKRLAADPRVEYVEQNATLTIQGTQNNPVWGLDRIDQRNLPLSKTYTYPNGGEGVTSYIADTGIYMQHPDFGGRATSGYDFIDNDTNASDCQGHGTHVAGTVGSTTYGVAKATSLVAVRVLNCSGSGSYAQIVAGIDWVAKNAKKPAVLNMSLGGGAASSVDTAVRNASNAGVTVVVASGNSNANACNYSPARAPEAITVNATDSSDNRASFSNYGTCSDIFAPGVSVTSTRNGGGTASMSGTSMASPHVAGAAAIYLSANPSATPAQVQTAMKNAATNNVVKNPGSGSPNKLLYVS
ncbi:S8 family peptidase [Amycolatopsis sp. YIM 10]|uniref:S8 family peptidase n=1 Tax=Amycolatopsis sp. YIM 10 TaxID=2653857 RepID=UPI001290188D|nr:S8 family peptidase [Amycolatopsis sp. YIM 10]QFU85504.1 Extracellular serine proteinase precursor [Amycolatopsis sp. YIM 10]